MIYDCANYLVNVGFMNKLQRSLEAVDSFQEQYEKVRHFIEESNRFDKLPNICCQLPATAQLHSHVILARI